MGEGAEEGSRWIDRLTPIQLVLPEPGQLRDQSIGQEYITNPTSLGDLSTDSDP